MQKQIKEIADAPEEKSQRAWRVKLPKEPVRESVKWHMQHKPYQGGGVTSESSHETGG